MSICQTYSIFSRILWYKYMIYITKTLRPWWIDVVNIQKKSFPQYQAFIYYIFISKENLKVTVVPPVSDYTFATQKNETPLNFLNAPHGMKIYCHQNLSAYLIKEWKANFVYIFFHPTRCHNFSKGDPC